MWISAISIRRPVFAVMILVALMILGNQSRLRSPVDQFPDVEWGFIGVSTVYPGASPETVERSVSRPIEEALNSIAGVREMSSESRPGFSFVGLQLELEEDVDQRLNDVRQKLSAVRANLPSDVEDPVIQSYGQDDEPIMSLVIASGTMDRIALTAYTEEVVKRRLESVGGVGAVRLVGGQQPQVKVTIKPERLQVHKIGINEIVDAVRASNLEVGAGTLQSAEVERDLTVTGRLATPADFGRIVVGTKDGKSVFLGQVADIDTEGARSTSAAFLDMDRSLALDIQKVKNGNTVAVADQIYEELEALREIFPPQTTIEIVRDNSEIIRNSIHEVYETLTLAALFTITVVFLFLGSWRSTVITGLTIPVTIVSSFLAFQLGGYSINVLSTMGIVISIGLIIDDAIVVRENIVRHLARGKSHKQAAIEGTEEIGLAVLATTFTLMAVFIPIAFMGGIIGKYFYDFGLTVAFAVGLSLLISFTLDPMLSSIWYDPAIEREIALVQGKPVPQRRGPARILDWIHDGIEALSVRYERAIRWSLKRHWVVTLCGFLAFGGAIFLFTKLGVSFVPETDDGYVFVNLEAPESSSLDYTIARALLVQEELAKVPEGEFSYLSVGADSGGPSNASFALKLVPIKERSRKPPEIAAALRPELAKIAGADIRVLSQQGGGGSGAAVALALQGTNPEELREAAGRVETLMHEFPYLINIRSSDKAGRRAFEVDVNREKAAWYGLDVAQIGGLLRTFTGEDAVSRWEDPNGEERDVILALPEEWKTSPARLGQLPVKGFTDAGPAIVPLVQVAFIDEDLGASLISRLNMLRVVQVMADVEGIDVGTANREFAAKRAELDLPPSVVVKNQGEGEQIAETMNFMILSLALAIVFIYLILASQFNSFFLPLAIMSSLPLALVGMALGLLLFGSTLNIMSMIGLIMLMGMVTKNAILLVEFANKGRAEGLDRAEALARAGRTRLRPILMTSCATIAGMIPLAFVLGAASEFRAPLAQAVIGGMLTSALLTLFVVPVAYIYWDALGMRLARLFHFDPRREREHTHITEQPAE